MGKENKNLNGTFIASDPLDDHKIVSRLTLVSDLDHYTFTHISDVYFNYESHPDIPPSLSIQPGRHLDHIIVPYYFTPINPTRLTPEEYEQLMNDNELENYIVPNEALEELAESLENLTELVKTIETLVNENSNEIALLNSRVNENSNEIALLDSKVNENSNEIVLLDGKVNENSNEIVLLDSKVNENSNEIVLLDGKVNENSNEIVLLDSRVNENSNEIEKMSILIDDNKTQIDENSNEIALLDGRINENSNEIAEIKKLIEDLEIPDLGDIIESIFLGNNLFLKDPTEIDPNFTLATPPNMYPIGVYVIVLNMGDAFDGFLFVIKPDHPNKMSFQFMLFRDRIGVGEPLPAEIHFRDAKTEDEWNEFINLSGIRDEVNKRIDEYNEKELVINPFEVIGPYFNVNNPAHDYPMGLSMIAQTNLMHFPNYGDPSDPGTIITFKTEREYGFPTAVQLLYSGAFQPDPDVSMFHFRQFSIQNEWSNFIRFPSN